jgi:hypothetical protein
MASPAGFSIEGANSLLPKYTVYDAGTKNGKSSGQKIKSLFGRSVFSPFPETLDDKTGNVQNISGIRTVHSDNMYDLSINSLIDYTNKKGNKAMRLTAVDFAYLKRVGVYPNNRLIIARRFPGPVGNDLTKVKSRPLATMITWFDEGDTDFFTLNYNEEWTEADADFTNVLNEIGESRKVSGDSDNKGPLGNFMSAGLNILPFGGFSEPLQRVVFEKLGLLEDPYNLPLGNPNLIREAKRRATVSKGQAGSGLACSIGVKMEVEYEQKFINGVDPTLVYLDIIQNALTFGTSDASFQFGSGFGNLASKTIQNLVSGNFSAIFNALKEVVTSLFEKVSGFVSDVVKFLTNPQNLDFKKIGGTIVSIAQSFFTVTKKSVSAIVGKYKVRLMGIINSLTGSPSTPWHITIGNPKRPIFSSGDMLLKTVDVTMGSTLAFNDLPTTIKFALTFENARPLGASEIFNRMNCGRGRSYIKVNIQKENIENDTNEIEDNDITTSTFEEYPYNEDGKSGKGSNHSDTIYSKLKVGENPKEYDWYSFQPPQPTQPSPSGVATQSTTETGTPTTQTGTPTKRNNKSTKSRRKAPSPRRK